MATNAPARLPRLAIGVEAIVPAARVSALAMAVATRSANRAMWLSGSIERSKNSSSSVSGCGTCGGLFTSTRSFRSRDYL
jgi:hypothetical protein